jgi:hypothetical protein
MKQNLLIIVLLVIVLGVIAYERFSTTRYQAVPATYTVWHGQEPSSVSTIFKIDTWTGQTWRYVEIQGPTEGSSTWMKIPN